MVHWHHVISILHLSNKYSIDYLLRRALVHLSSFYPTTLSEHDNGSMSSLGIRADEDILPYHIGTVQIAREVNALWILPAVFHHIASIDEAIVDKTLQCVGYNVRPAKLSDGDRILFLKSSMQISRQENFIMRFLHSPNIIPGCKGGAKCTLERLRTLADVQISLTEACEALHLLSPCNNLLQDCCRVCQDYSQKALKEARQVVWDRLPGFCGLPPWDELQKMKADALKA